MLCYIDDQISHYPALVSSLILAFHNLSLSHAVVIAVAVVAPLNHYSECSCSCGCFKPSFAVVLAVVLKSLITLAVADVDDLCAAVAVVPG